MNGHDSATVLAEDVRQLEELRLRRCAREITGRDPERRRIQRIACRLGGRDVEIEVGQPDPLRGADVLAILDLGRALSYAVYTSADRYAPTLQLGRHVYSVIDFD